MPPSIPPAEYVCPNCGTPIKNGQWGSYTCPNNECGHKEYEDTDFECDCDYCDPDNRVIS